jgi:hypothetical protein
MSSPAISRWDRETVLVTVLAALVSASSFLFYFRHDGLLLYGDAVAHINIARRVFDSRTPGLLQLGTVWLPLPHLLMIPFLFSDWAWRTGVGGTIPSLIAYVFGVAGVFRLARGGLSFHSLPDASARTAAWLAAGIYGLNPNLLYLQTTAMTEPLYLALAIWTVLHFNESRQAAAMRDEDHDAAASSSLVKCGLCLLGACLTRYDGWFLAVVICGAALPIAFRPNRGGNTPNHSFRNFLLLAIAAPALWLAYNALIYRNPLEFANGPYSARAIEQRTSHPGVPPHPGANDLRVAASYFLKSAELNLAEGNWQKAWLILGLAGTVLALVFDSRLRLLMLLWVPLPFYMLSVAYSGVPIFLPIWWPYSYYNVRYGLELLPAFAVFVALAGYFIAGFARNPVGRTSVAFGIAILIAGSYSSIWRAQPIGFREAWVNSRTRMALERELARTLAKLPPDSSLLMYLGEHVGALQQAGIPLRRVVSEGNHRTWKQPSDPEGLWERALANPSEQVDFVVAIDRDPVAIAIPQQSLFPIADIHVEGEAEAVVYSTHPPSR